MNVLKSLIGPGALALAFAGACGSSSGGGGTTGGCEGLCAHLQAGVDCAGLDFATCVSECNAMVGSCPSRASSVIDCLTKLPIECTGQGQAVAKAAGATASQPVTMVTPTSTLLVMDAACASAVSAFQTCAPIGSGGGSGFGGTSGSGGVTSDGGGIGGTSGGGTGGTSGGGTGGASSGGTGGASGGGTGGTSGGGTGGTGGVAVDECNPVTLFGCQAAGPGATCDQDSLKQGKFSCYPPPNTAGLCQSCNNSTGPYCGAGMKCLDGTCAKYCCSSLDCGTGVCDKTNLSAWGIGVCVSAVGSNVPADCNPGWYEQECFQQTGPSGGNRPMYAACVAGNECQSGLCSRGVCTAVCAGQAGPIMTCPGSGTLASNVTPACVTVPETPALKVSQRCLLSCGSGSVCPQGTTCSGGYCMNL